MSPRTRTGSPDLDRRIDELLGLAGAQGERRELLADVMATAVRLADDGADALDLKITRAAVREMRSAFRAFAPYRGVPKVTMFGSARTKADDPLYELAKRMARALADQGWMIVTGAGPGIMAAGMEGAGREHSFGVTIRLPFESGANSIIAGDEKLVSMKYFFTRKLMLIKESRAFVCLPGGFGTLDETFELLTLTQTGKGVPVPIVFLDVPGGTYWAHARRFIVDELVSRGLVAEPDLELFKVTDDVDAACDEILRFYANYHSIRHVDGRMIIRLRRAPDFTELDALNGEFGTLSADGQIRRTEVSDAEREDDDAVDLERLELAFDGRQHGRLRRLINALNELPMGELPTGEPPIGARA